MIKLGTKRDIISALRERGIHLKKSLGQNFLIDGNLLDFIVRNAELVQSDLVLEIGAGSGLLTRRMAEAAGHVVAVEIDEAVAALLREHTEDLDNVTLLVCDALESKSALNPALLDAVARALALPGIRRLKCVANLPYAVSTIVIPLLLQGPLSADLMVFTVQREVADRLAARPGVKDYGALSVIVQASARVEVLRTLGRKVFFPEPKVDSAIVRLEPTDEVLRHIRDYGTFAALTHALFQHRRKKAAGSLALSERFGASRDRLAAALAAADIRDDARADQLSVIQIVRLANEFGPENTP